MVAIFLGVAGLRWGQPVAQRVRLLYWQHRCLSTVGAGEHAWDVNGPAGGPTAATVAFGKFYALLSPPGDTGSPVVFMHERRTPDGRPRLVVLQIYTSWDHTGDPATTVINAGPLARVVRPGSLTRGPSEVVGRAPSGIVIPVGSSTWIDPGQCDPADPSHFTVTGLAGSQAFTIDGWLRDDETVALDVGPIIRVPPPGTPRRTVGP